MDLHRAVDAHLAEIKWRLKPGTYDQRRRDLRKFVEFVGGEILVRNVTRRHVEEWLQPMEIAASTMRLRALAVKMMFVRLMEDGHADANPVHGLQLPRRPRAQPRYFTADEVQAVLDACPDARARLVIHLAANEGLRRCEITGLEVSDVDTVSMTLRVLTAKGNGNEDFLPLTRTTAAAFREWINERGRQPGALISSYLTGRAINPGSLGGMVRKWIQDAGVKHEAWDGRTLHAFRHTMAQGLLDSGADPTLIQRGLRHQSLGTTWVYLRARRTVDELRPWMDRDNTPAGGDHSGSGPQRSPTVPQGRPEAFTAA